jgi:hypothetical protein
MLIYVCLYMYVYLCVNLYVYIYMCMQIQERFADDEPTKNVRLVCCMHIYMMSTCIYTCLYMYVYICMFICVYVCMCIYVYAYTKEIRR